MRQIFGGLELPGDFDWCERVIDAVAAVAQLLDLCERVGTPLFLCDDDIDVNLAFIRYCLSSSLRVLAGFRRSICRERRRPLQNQAQTSKPHRR